MTIWMIKTILQLLGMHLMDSLFMVLMLKKNVDGTGEIKRMETSFKLEK